MVKKKTIKFSHTYSRICENFVVFFLTDEIYPCYGNTNQCITIYVKATYRGKKCGQNGNKNNTVQQKTRTA